MMEEMLVRLAREVAERRYGKFRGFVVDNQDPQQRGRLRLRVPSVLGEEVSDWALPCMPFGGTGYGWFAIPDVEAQVWVEFEEGDVHRLIWVGTFWQNSQDVPATAQRSPPTTRLLATPGGHLLQFDDAPGAERITLSHPSQARMVIDAQGSVSLHDANGATLTLDAAGARVLLQDTAGNSLTLSERGAVLEDGNGNQVEMGPAGITVQAKQILIDGSQVLLGGAGGEPVLKGSTFLALFAAHTHPTGVGPSGPPIATPPGFNTALSTKVMTS